MEEIRTAYVERTKVIEPGQYDLEFYREYNYENSKVFKINHYPSEHKPDYFRKIYSDEPFLEPISYKHQSRYTFIKTLKSLGKQYHATNRLRGMRATGGETLYIVDNSTENRLDKISLMFYNDPTYWWLIAHANNIFDAFTEVKRGKQLRIPPLTSASGLYF